MALHRLDIPIKKLQKVDKIVVSLEVVGFPGPFALATRSLD